MNEQSEFVMLVAGLTIGLFFSALVAFLAIASFNKNPIRTMKIIIRRGDDVELELNEMHQIYRKNDDEHLVTRYKKYNQLIEVTTYKSKNLFKDN
ncbi:MAG: hypothetical protein ACE3L7_32665 [Candidatus Pristimantibacillus sp.]